MPCERCNGFYQCSPSGDPCDMSPSAQPLATETACLHIWVRNAGSSPCEMIVRSQPGPPPGGGVPWELAGQMCFDIDLFHDSNLNVCWVRMGDPVPGP